MGLLRALQPDIFIFLAIVLLTGVVWWLSARRFLPWLAGPLPMDDDIRMLRLWVNRIALLIMTLALIWLAWVTFTMSMTNQTPRSDIDRSGVYDQMNNLLEKKQ